MKLENIVPWGRSYEEYCSIFSLSDTDLNELGLITSLVDVEYQFQKGATQMLVVKSEVVSEVLEEQSMKDTVDLV